VIDTLTTIGGVIGTIAAFAVLLVGIVGYAWVERDSKRIWSTGTEAERFDDLITTVEILWKANEVDSDLRKELSEDLTAFCIDAQQRGATTTQVFGSDIEAFAMSWVDEHRQPPNQLKLALLRFANYATGWLALRSVSRTFRAITERPTDDSLALDVVLALSIGLLFAIGPLIGLQIGRFFGLDATGWWGVLGCLTPIVLLFGLLLGSVLLLTRGVQFFLGENAFSDQLHVPSLAGSLILGTIMIPLFITTLSAKVKENDKRISPLFDEDEDEEEQ